MWTTCRRPWRYDEPSESIRSERVISGPADSGSRSQLRLLSLFCTSLIAFDLFPCRHRSSSGPAVCTCVQSATKACASRGNSLSNRWSACWGFPDCWKPCFHFPRAAMPPTSADPSLISAGSDWLDFSCPVMRVLTSSCSNVLLHNLS